MVNLSPAFNPAILKGVKISPENPFQFDFAVDKGDTAFAEAEFQKESYKLIRYFLVSLTVPDKDLWVNLSPYERNRIIPNEFGQTEMGRDLLAQDYLLKQLTATASYPENDIGRKFWEIIYQKAYEKYGTIDIPIDTFNKVWVVPSKAVVYEKPTGKDNSITAAYVVKARLKVMLESDYLAANKSTSINPNAEQTKEKTQELAKEVVREVIIPELEREVNEGKNFTELRQAYHSLILAAWYKRKIKNSLLANVYVDQKKVRGVNFDDPQMAERIWAKYVEAFKKGVFNLTKEELDPSSLQIIERKYFSGGMDLAMLSDPAEKADFAIQAQEVLEVTLDAPANLPNEGMASVRAELITDEGRNIELLGNLTETAVASIPTNAGISNKDPDAAKMTRDDRPNSEMKKAADAAMLAQEIEDILKQVFTPETSAELAKKIREYHSEMEEIFKFYAKDADDPTFYAISPREHRAFVEEFLASFVQAILKKDRSQLNIEDLKTIIAEEFEEAQKIYTDVLPDTLEDARKKLAAYNLRASLPTNNFSGFNKAEFLNPRFMQLLMEQINQINEKATNLKELKHEDYFKTIKIIYSLLESGNNVLASKQWKESPERTQAEVDAYEKLLWVLRRNKPTLFVRPSDSLDSLEEAIKGLREIAPGLEVTSITGTPYSDRMQFIGSHMPVERKEGKDEGIQLLKFLLGVLFKLAENAKKNPQKIYLLKIDQFEAIPANVRGMLYELLLNGKTNIPEAPEEYHTLSLPPNMKIIATITESSLVGDETLYNRFTRKWLKGVTEADFKKILQYKIGFSAQSTEAFIKLFDSASNLLLWEREKSIKPTKGQLIIFAKYVLGRLKDRGMAELDSEADMHLFLDELYRYFFPGREVTKYNIDFDKDKNTLLIDGVELPLSDGLRAELASRLSYITQVGLAEQLQAKVFKHKREEIAKKQGEERAKIIIQFLKEKTGLTVTRDVLKVLSAAARSWRYGNRILLLEGTTGSGKTAIAAGLAKLFGLRFYGEPTHGESKQSKWLGAFKARENGDYYMDEDTPFLDYYENGGVVALSELNTAVENEQAKLGWWLIPVAKGETVTLNEFPREQEGEEIGRTIKRNPRHFIIVDFNPSSNYEARGELPLLLKDNVPSVWVEGRLSKEELKEVAYDFLDGLPEDKMETVSDALAGYHFSIQEELRKEERKFAQDYEHVISFRELKRACDLIKRTYKDFPEDLHAVIINAFRTVYVRAFETKEDRDEVSKMVSIPEGRIEEDLKAAMLVLKDPTLLIAPARENPEAILEAVLKDVPHVIRKINCNSSTNETQLFGSNIIDEEAQKEGTRRFKYGEGMLPEFLLEAAQAWEEDEINGVPIEKRRKFVGWFENYFYLRTGLAVGLNAVLQEGIFYSPIDKTPLKVTPNVQFFASVSTGTESDLSPAERSRWVRINADEKAKPEAKMTQGEKDLNLIEGLLADPIAGESSAEALVKMAQFGSKTQKRTAKEIIQKWMTLYVQKIGEPNGWNTPVIVLNNIYKAKKKFEVKTSKEELGVLV
ncbi:MAG: hypothetical protein HQL27_05385, partial [Candidatus Omnitrophica bacterium]|nr:hypothetical protein [Candidatus Omnitrophota bacterium]